MMIYAGVVIVISGIIVAVRLVVGGYYGFGAGIIVAGNSGIVMVPGLLAIMVSG